MHYADETRTLQDVAVKKYEENNFCPGVILFMCLVLLPSGMGRC